MKSKKTNISILKNFQRILNKQTIPLFAMLLILLMIIGVAWMFSSYEEKKKTNKVEVTGNAIANGKEKVKYQVYYSEKDDDVTYNYIVNPWKLEDKKIDVDSIQTIPARINEELVLAGYHGYELKITNVNDDTTQLQFDVSILGTKDFVKCMYDITTAEFNCYLEINEEE